MPCFGCFVGCPVTRVQELMQCDKSSWASTNDECPLRSANARIWLYFVRRQYFGSLSDRAMRAISVGLRVVANARARELSSKLLLVSLAWWLKALNLTPATSSRRLSTSDLEDTVADMRRRYRKQTHRVHLREKRSQNDPIVNIDPVYKRSRH
jgi:hypothetical protein